LRSPRLDALLTWRETRRVSRSWRCCMTGCCICSRIHPAASPSSFN